MCNEEGEVGKKVDAEAEEGESKTLPPSSPLVDCLGQPKTQSSNDAYLTILPIANCPYGSCLPMLVCAQTLGYLPICVLPALFSFPF